MNDRIKKISDRLKAGAIGVVPTDTIYGLVGSAFFEKSIQRIYQVKNRNPQKPLIVLVYDYDDIKGFGARISRTEEKILKKIWPGKVSVIFPAKGKKYRYLHRGTGKIAFRMPKSKIIRNILKISGPLVAPSANPESLPPAKNISEAKKYFGKSVDFYLGGRNSDQPSTLMDMNKGKIRILREGAVSGKKLVKLKSN